MKEIIVRRLHRFTQIFKKNLKIYFLFLSVKSAKSADISFEAY